ncbi:MAG: hypothetical protein L3J49_12610, partial [Desulfobulbaceae bacterium]|nr:hypothetical protein [Desulfobulbaceae bacterium]
EQQKVKNALSANEIYLFILDTGKPLVAGTGTAHDRNRIAVHAGKYGTHDQIFHAFTADR